MTDNELWSEMERLAVRNDSPERNIFFMLLLKTAYEQDLKLIMACEHNPQMPGTVRQWYMEVDGDRFLVCYTSKQRAERATYNMTWDTGSARELMNNMFNKEKITGIVFNPNDRKMILVFKDLLQKLLPGEKPKPKYFKE